MLFAQEAVKRENESMIVIEPHLIKYLWGGGTTLILVFGYKWRAIHFGRENKK